MWDLLLCMGRWHRPLLSHRGCGHKKRVLQMSVEFYMLVDGDKQNVKYFKLWRARGKSHGNHIKMIWIQGFKSDSKSALKSTAQIEVWTTLLHVLATHHHQQWAGISQNGKAKGCYFHFWKPATGSQRTHYIWVSFFRYLTLKINLWISQWNQHQILSYNHI